MNPPMNSKLRKIIYHISQHPLDDEDHEFDEDFEAAEKAIRQAVSEEMLELTNEQYERAFNRGENDPVYIELVELRQKIEHWKEGDAKTK